MKKRALLFCAICMTLISLAQTSPKLVGSLPRGGANNRGTIIQYSGGSTSISSTYSFLSNAGSVGTSSLTETHSGKLYGVSGIGGGGNGNVFEYDYATNAYKVRANFSPAYNTSSNANDLLLASNGLLYGMTNQGGANGGGIIFSYAPATPYALDASTVTKLVDLPLHTTPLGPLIQASNGKLYGLGNANGTNGAGSIFEYNIVTGAFNVLYSFGSGAYTASGLLEVGADTLYATTQAGDLFRYVIATNSYTSLTTLPSSSENTLIRAANGKLYGVTYAAGTYNFGVLFSYDIASHAYADVHDFGNGTDGQYPSSDLYQASDGLIYSMTPYGGSHSAGTIFSYNPSTSAYAKMVDLDSTTGYNPTFGHLIEYKRASILTQPSDIAACPGTTASFSAVDSSTSATAQWQISTNGAASFSNIPGATNATYSFTASPSQTGNIYRAVFTHGTISDTTIVALLTVWPLDTVSHSATICYGDTFIIGAKVFTATGTYLDTVGASVHGCDSIAVIYLAVLPLDTVSQSFTINPGQAVVVGGFDTLRSTGTFRDTLTDIRFCDSIVITHLTVVTGIADVSAYQFVLHPNPTSGIFMIDHDYPGSLTVEVSNILGEHLKAFEISGPKAQVDISDLSAGVYQVSFADGNQILKALKVLKE